MRSNTSSRTGRIGCVCRWPALGAFCRARRRQPHEPALAGSLCGHRGSPLRSVSLPRPARGKRCAGACACFCPTRKRWRSSTSRVVESDLRAFHDAGLFAGRLSNGSTRYHVRARFGEPHGRNGGSLSLSADIVRARSLSARRRHASASLREARRASAWCIDGVAGVAFAVFAPDARRVSVVGDFNFWDGRRHAMRVRGNGFWEIFVPGAKAGDKYKYEIVGSRRRMLPLKSDPVAFARRAAARAPPRSSSISRHYAAAASRSARRQCIERADIDL